MEPDEVALVAAKAALAAATPSAPPHIRPDGRALILDAAAEVGPGGSIEIVIGIPDGGYDWRPVREAGSRDARRAMLDLRAVNVQARAQPTLDSLAALGATNLHVYGMLSQASATVPVDRIADVVAIPDVTMAPARDIPRIPASWGGQDVRVGNRISAVIADGYTGAHGNLDYGTDPVRIGIYDTHPLALGLAPGWCEPYGTGCNNRRDWIDCSNGGGGCSAAAIINYSCSCPPAVSPSHADQVANVAAGSIERGQDANWPGTGSLAQRERSGMASGAVIIHYTNDHGGVEWKSTADRVIYDGVDILNHSYDEGLACAATADEGASPSLNDDIALTTASGVLNVFAAGNHNVGAGCTLAYPGIRRDGITVGALDTGTAAPGTYDTLAMDGYSGKGPYQITLSNGFTSAGLTQYAGVDIAAPGEWNFIYGWNGAAWTYSDQVSGTSFAAPSIAGVAAVLKEAGHTLGKITFADPHSLAVNLINMGDGWSSNASIFVATGMDGKSGAGRLHAHYPQTGNMTSPWGWTTHTATITSAGLSFYTAKGTAPMDASVTQWKVAMTFDEDDYTSSADLDLKVYDVCPPGGGAPVLLSSDVSYDIRSRVNLHGGVAGKCIRYDIVPSTLSGTRTVHIAEHYHSGPVADNLRGDVYDDHEDAQRCDVDRCRGLFQWR